MTAVRIFIVLFTRSFLLINAIIAQKFKFKVEILGQKHGKKQCQNHNTQTPKAQKRLPHTAHIHFVPFYPCSISSRNLFIRLLMTKTK